jgi:CRP-like cAMP-binding protein
MITELAMLVEVVHSATIVAQTQVKALSLPRERMHELMQRDPALAAHFSSLMIKRLREIADELSAIDLRLEGLTLSLPPPAIASHSNSVSSASLN